MNSKINKISKKKQKKVTYNFFLLKLKLYVKVTTIFDSYIDKC